jgi:hypothetical protein
VEVVDGEGKIGGASESPWAGLQLDTRPQVRLPGLIRIGGGKGCSRHPSGPRLSTRISFENRLNDVDLSSVSLIYHPLNTRLSPTTIAAPSLQLAERLELSRPGRSDQR